MKSLQGMRSLDTLLRIGAMMFIFEVIGAFLVAKPSGGVAFAINSEFVGTLARSDMRSCLLDGMDIDKLVDTDSVLVNFSPLGAGKASGGDVYPQFVLKTDDAANMARIKEEVHKRYGPVLDTPGMRVLVVNIASIKSYRVFDIVAGKVHLKVFKGSIMVFYKGPDLI